MQVHIDHQIVIIVEHLLIEMKIGTQVIIRTYGDEKKTVQVIDGDIHDE